MSRLSSIPSHRRALSPGGLLALVAAVGLLALPLEVGQPSAMASADSATLPVIKRESALKGQRLTLARASAAEVAAGDSVGFTGTATRKLVGRKVRLQRSVAGGAWVDVAVSRVGSDSTYSVSATASGGGVNEWRAVAKTKAKRKHGKIKKRAKKVVSNKVSTTVFQWYFLSDQEPADSTRRWEDSQATIGGHLYDKSVGVSSYWADTTEWGDYNLGYKCSQMAFSFGMDDASTTGATARFYLTTDGVRKLVGNASLGRATEKVYPVAGVLRVRLETVETSSGGEAYPKYGNARVLCSSQP